MRAAFSLLEASREKWEPIFAFRDATSKMGHPSQFGEGAWGSKGPAPGRDGFPGM